MQLIRPDQEEITDRTQDNPALSKIIERNIRTMIDLRLKAAHEQSLHDRIADSVRSGK